MTEPTALAQLRHLYQNMVNGAVRDTASAKRIAEGLLAPAIEALERGTPSAAQGDAPTDAGPISRQWLTVVYRGVEAGDEVQQICTHPKVSAMSWSHAIHDRDAARSQQGGK